MRHKFLIFSDYIWPFCYIGKGIVDKLKEEFDIEDEWLPLEIHPDTPKNGMELTKRFPAAQLNRMIENLKAAGKQYGIQFNEFTILSNSRMALAAGEYAKEKGKFHEFHEEAFNAYFTQGKDIGDIEIVSSIAEKVGLDSKELLKNVQEGKYDNILEETQQIAHENEINSTPTFIIDNKYAVVGAQALESFREAILEIEKEQGR